MTSKGIVILPHIGYIKFVTSFYLLVTIAEMVILFSSAVFYTTSFSLRNSLLISSQIFLVPVGKMGDSPSIVHRING